MTAGTDDAKRAWRFWRTDGIPASGANEPDKTEIRAAFDSIGLDILAAGSGGDPNAVRAVIEPIRDDALAAAGFPLRSDAITFAPKMSTGETTYVRTSDAGTHAAVAGEVALGGAAAVVGAQIPNAGVYAKQASGALWRVADLDSQKSAASASEVAAVSGLVSSALVGTTTVDFIGPQTVTKDIAGSTVSTIDYLGRRNEPMHPSNLQNEDGSPLFRYLDDPTTPWLAKIAQDPNGKCLSVLYTVPSASGGGTSTVDPRATAFFHPSLTAADFATQDEALSECSASLPDGTLYIPSVSPGVVTDPATKAPLYASEFRGGAGMARVMFSRIVVAEGGSTQTSDHSPPEILLDPRPGAAWPLSIYCGDHNGTVARLFRSSTGRVADLAFGLNVPPGATSSTYPTPFRNPTVPNTIWMVIRSGGGSSDGNWRISRSTDNGVTWTASNILLSSDGLYPRWSMETDEGLYVASTSGGTGTLTGGVPIALLKWSGQLVSWDNAGAEVQISANLFAETTPIDMLNDSRFKRLYTAPTGYVASTVKLYPLSTTRIFALLLIRVDGSSEATSRLIGITYDIPTNTITTEDICAAGGDYDFPRANAQYLGQAVYCPFDGSIIIARWWPTKNYGELVKLVRAGNRWAETTILSLPGRKVFRPRLERNQRWDATASKVINSYGLRASFNVGYGPNAGYSQLYQWLTGVWTIDTRKVI